MREADMNDEQQTRRMMLRMAGGASAFSLALLAVGCSKEGAQVCSDPSKLSDAEISIRTSMKYQESASDPQKACAHCRYFQAPQQGDCGTCDFLKGPVNAKGHCEGWTARA